MSSGVYKVEYQIDGGEISPATLAEDGSYSFPVPITFSGYAVVGIWVWDYALNCYYETFWYWLEGGHIKSVQPIKDNKYRMNMLRDHIGLNQVPDEPLVRVLRNDFGVKDGLHGFIVHKRIDQARV